MFGRGGLHLDSDFRKTIVHIHDLTGSPNIGLMVWGVTCYWLGSWLNIRVTACLRIRWNYGSNDHHHHSCNLRTRLKLWYAVIFWRGVTVPHPMAQFGILRQQIKLKHVDKFWFILPYCIIFLWSGRVSVSVFGESFDCFSYQWGNLL